MTRLALILVALAFAIQPAGAARIAAGLDHSLGVSDDGKVYAFGLDHRGQLGDGRLIQSAAPMTVKGIPGRLTRIAGGDSYSLAVAEDGSVWAWGHNDSGQLGLGSEELPLARRIPDIAGAADVAASDCHSTILMKDGSVRSLGCNRFGELGGGSAGAGSNKAVTVVGLSNVVAISAGDSFSLALKSDGSVWGWGLNDSGQLGQDGQATPILPRPQPIPGLKGIVAIAAGGNFGLALDSLGKVWHWGKGPAAQNNAQPSPSPEPSTTLQPSPSPTLAATQAILPSPSPTASPSPSTTPSPTASPQVSDYIPMAVSGLAGVTAIAAGKNHALAVDQAGVVYAWGANNAGQLGDGSFTGQPAPVQTKGLPAIAAIAASGNHSLALAADGGIYAWGANGTLQSGAETDADLALPIRLDGSATLVAAGPGHSLLIAADGSAMAWGDNSYGELGQAIPSVVPLPVAVSGIANAKAAAGGADFSLVLDSSGAIWAFGSNDKGQLGTGGRLASSVPVHTAFTGTATAIAAGSAHALAVDSQGQVWAWGANINGDLGFDTGGASTPRLVSGMSGAVSVAAGWSFSLALDGQGRVWTWGDNSSGQLGDGKLRNRSTPTAVPGLSGVVGLAAGQAFAVAVKNDGSVWVWGDNSHGELGRDKLTLSPIPLRINGLTDAVAVTAAKNGAMALRKDGSVWAWGFGDITTENGNRMPSPLPAAVPYTTLAAGRAHALGLSSDGSIWTWGGNRYGQLGKGTLAKANKPGPVLGLGGISFLDLIPGNQLNIPFEFRPRMVAVVQDLGSKLSAQLVIDDALIGKQGKIFVVARGPRALLDNLFASAFTDDIYVANTGSGWAEYTGGTLPAYYSGTLDQAQANVDLIDSYSTEELAGTEIMVGYGTSSEEMLSSGRVTTVVSVDQSTSFSAEAVASGGSSDLSLSVNLTVASADSGQTGNIYLGALIGGQFWFNDGSTWSLWSGGSLPAYQTGTLESQTIPVVAEADLSALAGAVVYVGYGYTEAEMISSNRYTAVYTIQ